MSRPLPIDARRVGAVAKEVEQHEEGCRKGVTRCQTCKRLYERLADACNIAARNATP